MSIHQAFHKEMKDAFKLDAKKIVELFDDINARLDYYEVINDLPTHESFSKVVERIKKTTGEEECLSGRRSTGGQLPRHGL